MKTNPPAHRKPYYGFGLPPRIRLVLLAAAFVAGLFAPTKAVAQTRISGKVVDKATEAPLAGASVFINNATYAQVCDVDGHFDLSSFPPPPFELTVAVVGYKAASVLVTASAANPLKIALEAKPVSLQEATVMSAEKEGWRKYGKQFFEDFIGYSPFAAKCRLLNKEVLQFRYNPEDNTLTVWADKPLLIRNEATGYQITYWLEDYVKNYITRRLYFKGYTQFTDLNATKKRRQEAWMQHRAAAYSGSLNHFMSSLYRGTTAGEGFAIRRLTRIANSDYGRYVPVWTDTIAFTDSLRLRTLLARIADTAGRQWEDAAYRALMQWKDTGTQPVRFAAPAADQEEPAQQYRFARHDAGSVMVQYYDLDRLSPKDSLAAASRAGFSIKNSDGSHKSVPFRSRGNFDIVNPKLIGADSFICDRSPSQVQFCFSGHLFITYTKELEEKAYLDRKPGGSKLTPGAQGSIINLATDKGITIYPDGNFAPAYDLMLEEYWAYEKLDKLLPLDYKP